MDNYSIKTWDYLRKTFGRSTGLDANFSVGVILISGRYCEENSLYISDDENGEFSIIRYHIEDSLEVLGTFSGFKKTVLFARKTIQSEIVENLKNLNQSFKKLVDLDYRTDWINSSVSVSNYPFGDSFDDLSIKVNNWVNQLLE